MIHIRESLCLCLHFNQIPLWCPWNILFYLLLQSKVKHIAIYPWNITSWMFILVLSIHILYLCCLLKILWEWIPYVFFLMSTLWLAFLFCLGWVLMEISHHLSHEFSSDGWGAQLMLLDRPPLPMASFCSAIRASSSTRCPRCMASRSCCPLGGGVALLWHCGGVAIHRSWFWSPLWPAPLVSSD